MKNRTGFFLLLLLMAGLFNGGWRMADDGMKESVSTLRISIPKWASDDARISFYPPSAIRRPQSEGPPSVALGWLDRAAPPVSSGVLGVPWPKGVLRTNGSFSLKTADGKNLPVQTWPLAYWPDGSIKWTGHAVSARPDLSGPLVGGEKRRPVAALQRPTLVGGEKR
jgi:hypothetical protein